MEKIGVMLTSTVRTILYKDKFIKEWTLINLQIEYFYDEELINDDIDF